MTTVILVHIYFILEIEINLKHQSTEALLPWIDVLQIIKINSKFPVTRLPETVTRLPKTYTN